MTTLQRLTVAEYQRLIREGVIKHSDRVVLLEERLVAVPVRSPAHDGTLQVVQHRLADVVPSGWRCRVRLSLELLDSQPEPDLCLVRGTSRTFLTRHPTPADVALVIEVADSSLLRDQRDKTRIYARAGLPLYWIVNLPDRRVEVYANPSGPVGVPQYGTFATYQPGDAIPLPLDAATVSVTAADLLP